jgi:hypothetical protein
MSPAVVTLRMPDPQGGSIAVRLPLWRPIYTRTQAIGYIASDELIAACLANAAAAQEVGNPAAALVAARMLRARPNWPWPTWLVGAVVDRLEQGASVATTGGRHARAWTRWQEDAADYLRYRAVEILRIGARRPVPTVYEEVADRLQREDGEHAAATGPAIEKAYLRVIKRTGPVPRKQAPYALRYDPRYFPDVATLHTLHAADVLVHVT